MSTQKPQPTHNASTADQRDDLTLDAATVADLEPTGVHAGHVRGAASASRTGVAGANGKFGPVAGC